MTVIDRPTDMSEMMSPMPRGERAMHEPFALSREEIAEISQKIREKEPRMEAPCALGDYLAYQQLEGTREERDAHFKEMYAKVKLVADSLVGHLPNEEIQRVHDESCMFMYKAMSEYVGASLQDSKTSFVFAVPTRIMRNFNPFSYNGADYRSEVAPFLPIAKYVDAAVVQKLAVGLPPCVIEDYAPAEDGKRGKLLFVPAFGDMMFDLMSDDGDLRVGITESRKATRVIMNDAARFARDKLGAEDMGLGAILASLTKFGTTIDKQAETELVWVREDPNNPYNPNMVQKQQRKDLSTTAGHLWVSPKVEPVLRRLMEANEKLETTTGHGGTVHLIMETIEKIINETSIEVGDTIAVVGAAGSIGKSTVVTAMERFPGKNILMLEQEKRNVDLESLRKKYDPENKQLEIAKDLVEVIARCNVITSAITERLDLDEIDPDGELDLTGKVFIDDSQPGCFDRAQIEARGGHLLWVTGHDPKGRVSRRHGYSFGDEEGLVGDSNWGCELEAWGIAVTGRRDLALHGPVTPEDVSKIGAMLKELGIKAGPFQSFGRLVHLPLK